MTDLITRLRTACSPESPLGKLCAEAADFIAGAADWNHDLTQAPTDGTPVWAACGDGKVYKTHYLPPLGKNRPEGRWCFLGTKEKPMAWKPFEVPVHPSASTEREGV